ncbi:MAG: sugar kinase [Myxococcales bacterium]|nr:sugar kinase [Myxococcales bacterium]
MLQVVVVGSVALDSVQTPFGKVEDALGGSATFFSLASSYFCNVGVVGVVGADFPKAHEDMLHSRGIDLSGFQRTEGATFRWAGKYSYDLNVAETLDTQLNVFANFKPELPEHYRKAPFLFLANIHPELQFEVLNQVEKPRFVACDTMNFWIDGARPALLRVLERVDALLINDSEARELAGEANIVRAAGRIHEMGPSVVVIKRGEYGALLSTKDGFFFAPGFPIEDVRDPTGAGDSFAGGFMGYLAASDSVDHSVLRQGVVAGSVLASFCVEAFSTGRYDTLALSDIRTRAHEFGQLMHVPGDLRII